MLRMWDSGTGVVTAPHMGTQDHMPWAYLARYPSLHSHLRLPPALLVSAPQYYHGRP